MEFIFIKMVKIDKGREVRDKVFQGNPYRQLGIMRESIWALAVLTENIDGDKEKAEKVLLNGLEKNAEVEELLNESEEVAED